METKDTKDEVKRLLPNTKGLVIASQDFAMEKRDQGGDAWSFRQGFEHARQILNESLPTPPTRTVTDEEIEKEFPMWEMPLDNTSEYEENVINQHKRDAVKWMRDKANTPKV